jgi:hypothetical protein
MPIGESRRASFDFAQGKLKSRLPKLWDLPS